MGGCNSGGGGGPWAVIVDGGPLIKGFKDGMLLSPTGPVDELSRCCCFSGGAAEAGVETGAVLAIGIGGGPVKLGGG